MTVRGKQSAQDYLTALENATISASQFSAIPSWMSSSDQLARLSGVATTSMLHGDQLARLSGVATTSMLHSDQVARLSGIATTSMLHSDQVARLSGIATTSMLHGDQLARLSGVATTSMLHSDQVARLLGIATTSMLHGDQLARLSGVATTSVLPLDHLSVLAVAASSFDRLAVLTAASETTRAIRDYETQFYLPLAKEVTALTNQFIAGSEFARLSQTFGTPELLHHSISSMTKPWVDAQDAMRSINSFASIHALSRSISASNPFDDYISDAWRTRLGDWRDSITYPSNAATNIVARSNFYTERGVDYNLADFPTAAFQETLEVTSLRDGRSTLVEIYGAPVPPSDSDEDEEAFGRTNLAHDWLQRLENFLRRFIDDAMTKEFGPDWVGSPGTELEFAL